MSNVTTNFNRYETKFLITSHQKDLILKQIKEKFVPDEYGNSTIRNIYYDTPDYLLIRRSAERPLYKEKLRIRSYEQVKAGTPVFAEIKKKYEGIVYKRRIVTNQHSAMLLLEGKNNKIESSQIKNEIDFFVKRYNMLKPMVFISYEREAFYDKNDSSFRITFDKNILWRKTDLNLSSKIYGSPILSKDRVLMEVKCSGAMPLWFTKLLSENKIYKTSFSKYGRAYEEIQKQSSGGIKYA